MSFAATLCCAVLLCPALCCGQVSKELVEVVADVVVKGLRGLLDCMDSYVTAVEASLVVMGSMCMTQVGGRVGQGMCVWGGKGVAGG